MIKSNKNKKKKKGFTLVELVAVIAIIGILAAVLVPKITGYIKEAKKVTVVEQARKVVTAGESIKVKQNITEATLGAMNITTIASKSGGLLDTGDITKIDLTRTYDECKNVLNAEGYKFELDTNNKLGSITSL